MKQLVRVTALVSLFVTCVMSGAVMGADQRGYWKIQAGQQAKIDVDADQVVRDVLPDTLFGFNINYRRFQKDLWDPKTKTTRPDVLRLLEPFAGSLYRYPGGTIANNFVWTEAVGSYADRKPQDPPYGGRPEKVLFGIDEYLSFLDKAKGNRFYVMNLGLDQEHAFKELDRTESAARNRELAQYLMNKPGGGDFPRYYQLGNELDRYKYEWPVEKYVERSRDTIEAVSAVDKAARFVAFFRDFRWQFKDTKRGFSDQYEFMETVLRGLPMVEDYSIHRYYDRRGEKARTFWFNRLARGIEVYKKVRNGRSPRVWVTEHGRQRSTTGDKSHEDRTNLSAAISAADYLIGLSQIPEVAGACLHAGGGWDPFGKVGAGPRPVYWALRVLRSQPLPTVLATRTHSPNTSAYQGGYDIRASAFTDAERRELGVWVANRAPKATRAELSYAPFAGKQVQVFHSRLSGLDGVPADSAENNVNVMLEPKGETAKFSAAGKLTVTIPGSSVSSLVIRVQ